jgi:hypothetical protein
MAASVAAIDDGEPPVSTVSVIRFVCGSMRDTAPSLEATQIEPLPTARPTGRAARAIGAARVMPLAESRCVTAAASELAIQTPPS